MVADLAAVALRISSTATKARVRMAVTAFPLGRRSPVRSDDQVMFSPSRHELANRDAVTPAVSEPFLPRAEFDSLRDVIAVGGAVVRHSEWLFLSCNRLDGFGCFRLLPWRVGRLLPD